MSTDTEPTATVTRGHPIKPDGGRVGGRPLPSAAPDPRFHDVAVSAADKHGVCVRPLVMRTLDLDTGVTDYVAVACKSTIGIAVPVVREKGTAAPDAATPRGLAPRPRTRPAT